MKLFRNRLRHENGLLRGSQFAKILNLTLVGEVVPSPYVRQFSQTSANALQRRDFLYLFVLACSPTFAMIRVGLGDYLGDQRVRGTIDRTFRRDRHPG
jgi:hypothetical protein